MTSTTHKITIETGSYNDRRYGRPWIATVDFSDPKGSFNFGNWVGSNGESGLLVIDAEPGQVIATGQKDNRNSRNSAPDFFIVQADGSLSESMSKKNAFKQSQASSSPDPKGEAIAAIKRLMAEHGIALGELE